MSNIFCPQCNKDDAIQKISAIVDAGKSSESYSGPSTSHVSVDGKSGTSYGYSYLTGSSAADLAKLLTPPSTPYKPGVGCVFNGAFLFMFIGFYILSLIIGLPLLLLNNSSQAFQYIYGCSFSIVELTLFFLLLRFGFRDSQRIRKEREQENESNIKMRSQNGIAQ